MGARPKETVDFADVETAQFGNLTDRQGLGDSQRMHSATDPSLALTDDSFSFEHGCRGIEDLVT